MPVVLLYFTEEFRHLGNDGLMVGRIVACEDAGLSWM